MSQTRKKIVARLAVSGTELEFEGCLFAHLVAT